MSTKTTSRANAGLDAKYGSGTAGGWYVAPLSAITDGAAGTVTEMTTGGASRKAISFAAASGRAKASNADITFDEATADNGDIVGWGIYSASSGGNLEHVIELDTPLTYDTGYQPVISSGDLTISEAAYA